MDLPSFDALLQLLVSPARYQELLRNLIAARDAANVSIAKLETAQQKIENDTAAVRSGIATLASDRQKLERDVAEHEERKRLHANAVAAFGVHQQAWERDRAGTIGRLTQL